MTWHREWTIPRRTDHSHWRALAIAAFVVLCGITSARAHEADGHPARIYHGSCSSLGEIAFPLTGVGAHVTTAGTPVAATQTMGSEEALPIQTSATPLDATLTDLTEEAYAIVIYESDEAMDRIIACGNIGGLLTPQMAGMVMPGDALAIGLGEENDSSSHGVALLRAEEGGTSTLTILLATEAATESTQASATPAATP